MNSENHTVKNILIYKGKITLKSEFSSGELIENDITDNPVIRNTEGSAFLRGESLAGLIRQELVRIFDYKCQDYNEPGSIKECFCEVCSLMGHSRIPPEISESDRTKYHSSRLKAYGGVFKNEFVRIRHGVAIERKFQVSALHKKYDYEVLLPESSVQFNLEIEDPKEYEVSALDRLLAEMKYGFISLGGKKGAGLGAFTLKECKKRSFDMNKKVDVIAYLLKDFGKETDCDALPLIDNREEFINKFKDFHRLRLIIPFDIWFPELFLVNDPLEASLIGSDHVSMVDKEGKPWLPASTIRGVLRSRAEQILRTLNPRSACDPTHDRAGSYLTSCSVKLEDLKKREEQKGSNFEPPPESLNDGTLLCMGCRLFGSTFWGSRLYFQTGKYNEEEGHQEVLQHFVAIDRFTGGGKEGAKYDALPLYNVKFTECRLIIEGFSLWQMGLLALVFKDLIQSDMRMGFGTRKGYGQAVGTFSHKGDVLLSTPDKIYRCKIGEIYNNEGVDNKVKKILETAVGEFRQEVKRYKGTAYETA